MRIKSLCVILFGLSLVITVNGFACEEYKKISLEEAKEYRAVIGKADADSLDRMFAIDQLVCSDNPNLRAWAIQHGLKNSSDPLVRNQVMLTAMMQKQRIDIKLDEKGNLSKADKLFAKNNSGVYSLVVQYRSKKDGCISFLHKDRCSTRQSLYIKGDKIEFNLKHMFGEFRLSESNELVGYLRQFNKKGYGRIPAVIPLD